MKPDREKVVDLFANISSDIFSTPRPSTAPKQKNQKQSKGIANANNKQRMLNKLEDELFSEFNEKDWFQYFVYKAEQNKVKYLARNYAKDYTIIKSILTELTWVELKDMIDFIWDSPQDIMEKKTVGIWILSKGWINTIYQNSLLWKDGKYRPKTAPTHNREWIAEASTKPPSGLSYGKPVRDREEDAVEIDKPKKSRIRVGLGISKRKGD